MSTRPCSRSLVFLALLSAIPATALANSFIARLDRRSSFPLSALKNATIHVKTTGARGANGILVSAKVSGARDTTGVPANLTLMAQVSFDNEHHCSASGAFPVPIVNGSAKVTVTGTDIGLSENNFAPGRTLSLCIVPRMLSEDFMQVVLEFHLFNHSSGKILVAPFILSTAAGNPITSWSNATFNVQNVKGAILATTKISGAKEGNTKSSRTLIPLIPAFDGVNCSQTPYFLSAVLLGNGKGKSTTPNLDNGGSDPGPCLRETGLEDSSLNIISYGLGVVQGIDPD